MAHFPLSASLSNDDVIRITCKLYSQSVFKVLPISIILILLYNFVRYGVLLYPPQYAHLHPQNAIFAVVFFLPLTGTLFSAIDTIGKSEALNYGKLAVQTLQRFLALAGCFFSMLLLPALVLGACAGVYFYLSFSEVNLLLLFAWTGISALILFAICVPKLFAPILVFIDNLGANESIDESARIVKGNFIRSVMFSLLAGLILFFFASMDYLLTSYLPIFKTMHGAIPQVIAQILLLLIGPWSFALLLTLKYDLQMRHPIMQAQASTQKREKTKMEVPQSVKLQKKNDEDKFNF